MHIHHHRIDSVKWLESPNHDDRPDPDDIVLVVIHCISLPPEQFGGDYIDQLFCNRLSPDQDSYFREIYTLRVSAHVLIRRDGIVVQYVPFDKRAWHAGISIYQGRERCNDFSIGIELEGSVNQPFEDAQYQQLAKIIRALLANYPKLSTDRIVGHSDIAPGRKNDPGPWFDWQRLRMLLNDEDDLALV